MPIGGEISVADANNHINEYITDYFDTGKFPVKSFIFDATLLKNYLNNNATIENMKFMLGEKQYTIDGKAETLPTLVVVGYDSSGNYIKSSPGMVLDNTGPCPPNCPTVGNAANDNIS